MSVLTASQKITSMRIMCMASLSFVVALKRHSYLKNFKCSLASECLVDLLQSLLFQHCPFCSCRVIRCSWNVRISIPGGELFQGVFFGPAKIGERRNFGTAP